jgi:hypothetical protein
MTINEFDVNVVQLRDDYFPHVTAGFTENSSPTAETVERYITEEAATLGGKLLLASISVDDIVDDESSEWVWCTKVLTLMVAIRTLQVMSGQNPAVAEAWEKRLAGMLADLSENGELALGLDSSGSDSDPKGPTDHISELGLDIGDTADASDVIPSLRRSDAL